MKLASRKSSSKSGLDNRRTIAILSLVVAAVFFLALNSISNSTLRGVGVDLTEDNVFTLSEGTRRAINAIDEPITFRLFTSPQLTERFPQYNAYAQRVRSLIDRYVAISNGKIQLEVYHPEPFSDAEDLAASYGLTAIPINQSGDQAYFGLAGTNSVDTWEKIGFFHLNRESNIEQDLTRMVVALGPADRATVGVITSLPLSGSFQMGQGLTPPWPIMEEINSIFEVKTLSTDEETIPEEVDVLLIAHPRGLTEKTLYAIDQYVMRGGHVLAMVDPLPEMAPRRRAVFGMSPVSAGSELPRLLESWGVRLRPGRVAGDRNMALMVNTGRQGRDRIAPYIVWLDVKSDNMKDGEPLLEGIDRMILPSPGIIDRLENAQTQVEPLIFTSRNSMPVNVADVRQRPDFEALVRAFEPSNNVLPLAVRITGEFDSAFDGPPSAGEESTDENEDQDNAQTEENAQQNAENQSTDSAGNAENTADDESAENENEQATTHIAHTQRPANIIVVADSDMLHQQFWRQGQEVGGEDVSVAYTGNAAFVLNALDSLSGANYMLGLRGKGDVRRPFVRVQEMAQQARERLEETRLQLVRELQETQERLRAARTQTEDGKVEITEEQRAEIDRFQGRVFEIRRELRQVQFQLREDVDKLDAQVKFVNIGLIPALIGFIAIGLGIYRHRRRRRRYETG